MNQRILNASSKALVALFFTVFLAPALATEPNHIADFIRYEVKVIKVAPDDPNDTMNMEQIITAQEEYSELLIESGNKKLQLAYIKSSIIGTLEMVPFDEWDANLAEFEKEIEQHASADAKEPNLGDYVRLRGQLAVIYADIFKVKYGLSYSPKIERILKRFRNKQD
ncbi:MAG: hypothetical protein AAF483_03750 [Planctomycetota bacterium]